MTVSHELPGWIWWTVTSAAGTVLVPADRHATPTKIITKALCAMGHHPRIEARLADGTWTTPNGPLPVGVDTRWAHPAHLVDACTVHPATPDDLERRR